MLMSAGPWVYSTSASVPIGTIVAAGAAHVVAAQVLGRETEVAVGLHEHREHTPELLDLVGVGRTQIALQRVEDAADRDAERLRLGAVDVGA